MFSLRGIRTLRQGFAFSKAVIIPNDAVVRQRELLRFHTTEKRLGFEIGINTFENDLFAQLITPVFCIRNLPCDDFDPIELELKYVGIIVGRENGIHLLGFYPLKGTRAKEREFYDL